MSEAISIIIHSYNEEKNIEGCIKSAHLLTPNINVVDMESQDQTRELAAKMKAKVYLFSFSSYVEPARKFGIEKAKSDWVFILDADERMTEELSSEVKKILKRVQDDNITPRYVNTSPTYYKVPRKNIFRGKKWLKYGDWYPDYQIRLIKKEAFVDWPKEIHSTPIIKGVGGVLSNPFLHFFHQNLENMVEKTIVFEDIESDLLFKAKREVNVLIFFRKFWGELYRRLVRHFGFLDGSLGIIEAIYQAFSKTITYLFLYEKYRKKSGRL